MPRLKIRTIRILLWTGCALGVTLNAVQLVRITQWKSGQERLPGSTIERYAAAPPANRGGPATVSFEEFTSLFRLNVTGKEALVHDVVPEPTSQHERSTIDQHFAVSFISLADPTSEGWASVSVLEPPADSPTPPPEGRSGSSSTRILQAGDPLPAPFDGEPYYGRVVEVAMGKLVCEWYDEQVDLRFRTSKRGSDPIAQLPFRSPAR